MMAKHTERTPGGQEITISTEVEPFHAFPVRLVLQGVSMICTFDENAVEMSLQDARQIHAALGKALAHVDKQTYILRDSTGKVLFRGVPESQREQAEQIATMLDGGIRRTLARAAGAAMPREVFTWEVEDPTSTETYSVYSFVDDEE